MRRARARSALLAAALAGLAACETGNAPLEDGHVPPQQDYYDESAYGMPTLPDTWEESTVPADMRFGVTEVPEEDIGRGSDANPGVLYNDAIGAESEPVLGPFDEDLFD